MSEVLVLEGWLYERLAGDATLQGLCADRVFADLAPVNTPFPFIVYGLQSILDVNALGGVRIMCAASYVVKAIGRETAPGEATFTTIAPLADRIDALLHRASGTVAAGQVLSCVREAPLRFVEVTPAGTFRHLGGIYRLQAQAG